MLGYINTFSSANIVVGSHNPNQNNRNGGMFKCKTSEF